MNIKKFFVFILSIFLFVGSTSFTAYADHTDAHTVEQLQQQIADLLSLVAELQQQLASIAPNSIPPAVSPAQVCPVFAYNLYLERTDADTEGQVTELQTFLARDPSIYPEGLVTGFFGPLTEQAVQRWQAKYDVVSSGSPETTGYGVVGPKTRAAIRSVCTAADVPSDSDPDVGKIFLTPDLIQDTTIISGSTQVDLGHYTIRANLDSNVRITSIEIWADVINGDLDNFTSLQLFNGATPLTTGTHVVSPSGTPHNGDGKLTFILDAPGLIIPKGITRKTITLKGSVTTGASSGDMIRFDFSPGAPALNATITDIASGQGVSETYITKAGAVITTQTGGGWSVSLSPAHSAGGTIVPAGSNGVLFTMLRFNSTKEEFALTDLELELEAPASAADIERLYIYDAGGTLLRTVVPSFVNGVQRIIFPTSGTGSFIIPKDSHKRMVIRADISEIGRTKPGTAGHIILLKYNGEGVNRAIGQNSGQAVLSTTKTDILGSSIRYFKSIPRVERVPIPVTTLTSGNQVLYKFKITADPAGDIAFHKIAFQMATSGIVQFSSAPPNFVLWNTTDNKRVGRANLGLGFSASTFNDPRYYSPGSDNLILQFRADTTDYTDPWVTIPAGQTRTFEIRGDIALSGAAASVTTYPTADTGYQDFPRMASAQDVLKADGTKRFIWTDFSADTYTTHSLETPDWTNGYRVPGCQIKEIYFVEVCLEPSTLSSQTVEDTNIPSITVLSPNGGEQITPFVSQETTPGGGTVITWSSENIPPESRTHVHLALISESAGEIGWINMTASCAASYVLYANGKYVWDGKSVCRGSERIEVSPGAYKIEARLYLENYPQQAKQIASDLSDATFTIIGQTSVIDSGDWSVSVAPAPPSAQWVPGGTQNTLVTKLRFFATDEDIALNKLRLRLNIGAFANAGDAPKLHFYDGTRFLQSHTAVWDNGVEDIMFPASGAGSFIIPQNGFKDLTITVDVPKIDEPGVAGNVIIIGYDGRGPEENLGIGQTSGKVIESSTKGYVGSTGTTADYGVKYFRSVPHVSRVALPSTSLVSGNLVLYRFRVAAQGGEVALHKFTFQVATNGITPFAQAPASFTLWDTTTNRRIGTAGTDASYYNDPGNYDKNGNLLVKIKADTLDLAQPYATIFSSSVFELRADITTDGVGDSVATKLLGDTWNTYRAATAGAVESSPYNNFIWSDFSGDIAGTHSLTSEDWFSGFLIPGFVNGSLGASALAN